MNNRNTDIHERNIQRWLHRDDCDETPALTGLLVAIPLGGIGYRTATQRGFTNRKGEFRYLPGERVIFFIGEADFPTANAGTTVTPYDMGTTCYEPVNIFRLLHSVCMESSGTLFIPASIAELASSPIDFSTEPSIFEHQLPVAEMLGRLGRALIDEKTAVDRLDAMIVRYVYRS